MAVDVEQTEFTDESRVIHVGPCEVDDLTMAADNGAADCDLYDGVNNKARRKVHLEAISGTTFSWSPTHHANFHYGIYIKVSSSSAKVTVMYKPTSPKGRN